MKIMNMSVRMLVVPVSLILVGCNGGMNLAMSPSVEAESSPITAEPTPTPTPTPTTTPAPTPTPTPSPNEKNRVFVSVAEVKAINTESEGFFNYVCYREARRNKIPGKFVALVATSKAEFKKRYQVTGYLYQKFLGVENVVASNLDALFDGKNDSIFATAYQTSLNTSVKNTVWTGQRNFHQTAQRSENCSDWSSSQGEAIVGIAGKSGSDATAAEVQTCNTFSHLYCIEID